MDDNNRAATSGKALTIAFCAVLAALTLCAFVYLHIAPDFVPPEAEQADDPLLSDADSLEKVDYDSLLFEASMQDMLDYLSELGYIHQETKEPMSIIGTDNWICDGLDLIWWDVEHLEEGTEPWDYWHQMQDNGFIIYGGTIYAPRLYGPFGINVLPNFSGNPDQLDADMQAFGEYLARNGKTE